MTDNRFTKSHRLLKAAEFEKVFAARRSAADALLVAYALPNQGKSARLGLVVSRKVGPAVVRNIWKRRLREAFRLTRLALPEGLDLIVLPRAKQPPEVAELALSLARLAERLSKRRR